MGGPPDLEIAQGMLRGARERLAAGQLDAAASMAERARDLFHAAEAVGPACEAARLAAATRMRRGDLGGARALYEWVAEEGQADALAHEVALARTELGGIAEAAGDLRQALDEHIAAFSAAVSSDRVDLQAIARGNLGRLRQRSGELEAARADLEASRAGFLEAGVPSGAVNATICLGDLCRQEGHIDQARARFEQAQREAAELGHVRLESLAALNLGHAARDQGDRDAAARAFERAAELAERTREPLVVGGARLGLGLVLAEVGPIGPALTHFEAAEAVFLGAGNAQAAIAATVNAASLSCRLGDLHAGRERMIKAIEVLEVIGDGRGSHEVGLALAEVAVAMGQLGEAETLLERYADASRFATRLGRRRALLEARLAARALQIDSAVAALAEADHPSLQGSEAFGHRLAALEIGLLAGQRGVQGEAMALCDETDERENPREAAAGRTVAGLCAYWLDERELAREQLEEAVRLWRRVGETVGLAAALELQARLDLLDGGPLDVDALEPVEAVLREGGALDTADGIALLLRIHAHRQAVQRGELPEGADDLLELLGRRIRRIHRLGVWSDLHLIARLFGDAEAADEADALAADGAPAAPAWRFRDGVP